MSHPATRLSLTLLATLLIIGGVTLLLWEPRMQIISLVSVFTGLLLACIALLLHLRGPLALLDLLLLTTVALTVSLQSALPEPLQDVLFKLGA